VQMNKRRNSRGDLSPANDRIRAGRGPMSLPRLYTDLASWWPLLSPPDEEYEAEADVIIEMLIEALGDSPATILELGSGGGNNASYL
jgi:hypothetical protein